MISLSGWRGETVSFRFDYVISANEKFTPQWTMVPGGFDVQGGVLRNVRYVTQVHGTEYSTVPDRVEWNGTADISQGEKCVAVGSVKIPANAKPGEYELAFGGEQVKLHVADRLLQSPDKWGMGTYSFWHHPWALARVTDTKPWSDAHFEAMRPFLAYTKAIGLRTVMCTIGDLPWNHQCYDPNLTMVKHIKHFGTGEWKFDYTIFDKWVEFSYANGNGPDLALYAICPWDYEVFWLDESGRPWHCTAKPGTKEYEDYWGPFIPDLRRHLIEKGWFQDATLKFDERKPEDVKACIDFIRRTAPDFRIGASGDGDPELFRGIKLDSYNQILMRIDDSFFDKAKELRKQGRKTCYYVCCGPEKPNTFVYSDPDDAFWLGVFPAARGLDGFSRWTFDSFPENAMVDATYACWPSGDTFMVYPDASPSWRYLMLLNGVQNGEKWRILSEEGGEKAAQLEVLSKKYDVQQAMNKHDGDFKGLIAETLKALNW